MTASARPDTIFASSSSGIMATLFTQKLDDDAAQRVLIGHPFNPPHQMPLVEVVPGRRTSEETVSRAMDIYRFFGKTPILIKKEVPGFVDNRLQAALIREAISLVEHGVISGPDLDTLVEISIGMRWAAVGPFKAFHLGGGPGGFQSLTEHILRSLDQGVKPLGYDLSDEAMQPLFDSLNQAYGLPPKAQIAQFRDRVQDGIIHLRESGAK